MKKSNKINVAKLSFMTIFVVLMTTFATYIVGAFTVPIFASTEYVSEKKNIYGVWQNRYYEEFQNGKHKTTKEINRYYYKLKNGDTYYDAWTSYEISDFTLIEDDRHEYIQIERLHYTNKVFDVVYDEDNEGVINEKKPKTKAHYFIHKKTAKELGINLE